jgi:chemotaxis protein MotB
MKTTKITVALALLLAGAGCVSSGKYEKKAKEAAESDAKAQQAGTRATTAEAKVAELQAELDATKGQLAAAQKEKGDLQAQAAHLEQQKGAAEAKSAAAEAKSAQYEQLAGSLQQQIKAGQVEISELRGKMTVKLKDKVLFSSGSARLNKEGMKALDAIAGAFKDMQGKNVIVAGYTDDVRVAGGAYKDNWDLSSARAIAVVRYLAAQGVPPRMLAAAGFSEYRPIVPNDSAANRSQNRRIEIALTAADYEPPVVAPK